MAIITRTLGLEKFETICCVGCFFIPIMKILGSAFILQFILAQFIMRILLVQILLFSTFSCFSQVSIAGKSCVGTWKTIDDETGRPKSYVKIWEEDSKFYGKIVKILDPKALKENNVDQFSKIICKKCPEGKGKGRPVLGLKIIWDMEQDDDEWNDGEIMDPKNGRVYGCSMWLEDDDKMGNTLKVRGWLAFIYRTQTWCRVN